MEPIRRDALVHATIHEIGAAGTLDITVARIAKRAGMSSALAHHYFGSKERLLTAAMRHILTLFGEEVRREIARADGPRARIVAIIHASFTDTHFQPEVISAWLNFYVHARINTEAGRLLHLYHARLRANLLHDLRALCPAPEAAAETIAALIDGVYLRQALRRDPMEARDAEALILNVFNTLTKEARQ